MHARRPIVLLTGFGPFPRVAANATSILVPQIASAARRAFAGIGVVDAVIATEWVAAPRTLHALVEGYQPSVAIHFGVSSRATGFVVESRGRNATVPLADACGEMPASDCHTVHGPEYRMSTLPPAHLVARLRRAGLPASLSRDAGGYLCNALLYHSVELGRRLPRPMRTTFIHLPDGLASMRNPERGPEPGCPLDWPETIRGGLEIIAAALGRPPLAIAGNRRRP